jgi:hypothetical protein
MKPSDLTISTFVGTAFAVKPAADAAVLSTNEQVIAMARCFKFFSNLGFGQRSGNDGVCTTAEYCLPSKRKGLTINVMDTTREPPEEGLLRR